MAYPFITTITKLGLLDKTIWSPNIHDMNDNYKKVQYLEYKETLVKTNKNKTLKINNLQ